MADNQPGPDAGALLHARGITGGGTGQGKTKTDDYANAENALGEHAKASVDKAGEAAGLTIPVVGKAISLLFSGNSATAGLESEGLSGKMIMPSVLPDAQGGFLARLLAILGKGRDITDLTAGTGGDAGGGGAFSDGGMASGGGDFSDLPNFSDASAQFSANASDMLDFGSGNFSALGGLSSPLPIEAPVISTPSRGGAGAEIA